MTKKNFDPDATFEANRSNYLESLDAILNEWFPRVLNEDNIRWNQKLDKMEDKTRRDITKATGITPLGQQIPHYIPPHKEDGNVVVRTSNKKLPIGFEELKQFYAYDMRPNVDVQLVGDLTLPKELKDG